MATLVEQLKANFCPTQGLKACINLLSAS